MGQCLELLTLCEVPNAGHRQWRIFPALFTALLKASQKLSTVYSVLEFHKCSLDIKYAVKVLITDLFKFNKK